MTELSFINDNVRIIGEGIFIDDPLYSFFFQPKLDRYIVVKQSSSVLTVIDVRETTYNGVIIATLARFSDIISERRRFLSASPKPYEHLKYEVTEPIKLPTLLPFTVDRHKSYVIDAKPLYDAKRKHILCSSNPLMLDIYSSVEGEYTAQLNRNGELYRTFMMFSKNMQIFIPPSTEPTELLFTASTETVLTLNLTSL